jgi:hypothetical protein
MSIGHELPIIAIKPVWTDDDREFHSDMGYMHDLLVEIHELAYCLRFANPIPITMSDELDAAITAVQAIR